jgi:murein DD-endopeptidase MepM/ murein hydrolase activator NlpD
LFVLVAGSLLAVQLAAPRAAHAASIVQLRQQLAVLRQQAAPAGDAYDAALTTLGNTQDRIKSVNARIASATKKLGAAQSTLGARADVMYRQGEEMGMFEVILGATSWDDFITRLNYMTIIASNDAALISDVKATRAGLQADRTTLTAEARTEKSDLAKAAARQHVMEAQLAAKQAQYDRVLAAISAQSGGKHPPGPNGLVFPVHGVHYYSDTWGAPRSGGRHHMGTDIMSPRGTPVLAVCDGSARPHWNTLGGNSISLTGKNGWVYYYAHLDHYAIKGTRHVKAGQVIGYVGNSGDAKGGATHLHFQMGPHARWVDPYRYLRAME